MRRQTAVDNEGRVWRMIVNSFLILAVAAVTTARSNPTRIRISSFGVNSTVMKLGLLRDGSVRVSLPHFVLGEEINRFCNIIPVAIANVRRQVRS